MHAANKVQLQYLDSILGHFLWTTRAPSIILTGETLCASKCIWLNEGTWNSHTTLCGLSGWAEYITFVFSCLPFFLSLSLSPSLSQHGYLHGKFCLLAFDKFCEKNGQPNQAKTTLVNQAVLQNADLHILIVRWNESKRVQDYTSQLFLGLRITKNALSAPQTLRTPQSQFSTRCYLLMSIMLTDASFVILNQEVTHFTPNHMPFHSPAITSSLPVSIGIRLHFLWSKVKWLQLTMGYCMPYQQI